MNGQAKTLIESECAPSAKVLIGTEKGCSKCKEIRSTNEYSPHNRAKDGLQSQCRKCKGVTDRLYQQKRRAKIRAAKIKMLASLPPKKCAIDGCNGKMHGNKWCKEHYLRNHRYGDPLYPKKKKHNKCTIEGCEKKPRSGHSEYCETHYYRIRRNGTIELRPISTIFADKNYRYKTIRDGEKFKAKEIYDRDAWICGICNKKINKKLKYPHPMSASIDHIIPIALGGQHKKINVQIAHLSCNVSLNIGGIKQLRLFG